MMFTNKTYDVLKYLTQIFLPAFGTLYVALAKIWNLPYPEQVSGTIIAVVLFLGVILQISTVQYQAVMKTAKRYPPVPVEAKYEEANDQVLRTMLARKDPCADEDKDSVG